MSSHVLGELDRISDRVLVMAQGRVVAAGTSHGLRELLDDRPMKVRVGTDRPRDLRRLGNRCGDSDHSPG